MMKPQTVRMSQFEEQDDGSLLVEFNCPEMIYVAEVEIAPEYPVKPPIFTLKAKSGQTLSQAGLLPEHLLQITSHEELAKVEGLRSNQEAYLSSGEPVQPILDAIEDELHLYYGEFCNECQQVDLLLSFQIRKLMSCLELISRWSQQHNQDDGQQLFDKTQKGKN